MEIRTKAYIPINLKHLSNDTLPAIVSDEIILVNNKIIALNLNSFGKDHLWGVLGKTEYEFEFLDHHDNDLGEPEQFTRITYCVRVDQYESIYIKPTDFEREQLKWMNKMFWIQKDNNLWKLVALIIASVTAIVSAILSKE